MTIRCAFRVNGDAVEAEFPADARLLDVLRERLGLTGTKEGCGNGECGACTVLVDGQPVNSCLFPAGDVEGREVTTIEGLGDSPQKLSDVQEAFVRGAGIQCGFCTPGMIVSTHALLARIPLPDERAVREAIKGNLCRCTGYRQIVDAVLSVAHRRSERRDG